MGIIQLNWSIWKKKENQVNFLTCLKAPEPAETRLDVHEAFDHGNVCVQPSTMVYDTTKQSEDCLFLNIYVPGMNFDWNFKLFPSKILFYVYFFFQLITSMLADSP